MEKVLFALGHRTTEEFLENALRNEFYFVGAVVSKEGLLEKAKITRPNIVILREGLSGNANILDVAYTLVNELNHTRVIFLAGDRKQGDALLANLVNIGIYDILYGGRLNMEDLIKLMRVPNERRDVAYLQPKPVFDEKLGGVSFETNNMQPREKIIIQERIREVFIDEDNQEIPESQVKRMKEQRKREYGIVEEEEPIAFDNSKFVVLDDEDDEEVIEIHSEPQYEEQPYQKPRQSDYEQVHDYYEEPYKEPEVFQSSYKEPKEETRDGKLKNLFQQTRQRANVPPSNVRNNRGGGNVITFIGSKGGVGTTTLAISFAAHLAKKNKVLYVEVNDVNPSTPMSYNTSNLSHGIETAIQGLLNRKYKSVHDAIVTHSDLIERDDPNFRNAYKKYPKTLDFLTYSNEFIAQINQSHASFKNMVDIEIRELYLFLTYQTNYDYIVFDVQHDYLDAKNFNALAYSNKVFYVVSQDIAAVSYVHKTLHELEKTGLDMKPKTTLLINRYEKSLLSSRDFKSWLEVENILEIPYEPKVVVTAAFNGELLPVATSSGTWRKVWNSLEREL